MNTLKQFSEEITEQNPTDISYAVGNVGQKFANHPLEIREAIETFAEHNHLLDEWCAKTCDAWKTINRYIDNVESGRWVEPVEEI